MKVLVKVATAGAIGCTGLFPTAASAHPALPVLPDAGALLPDLLPGLDLPVLNPPALDPSAAGVPAVNPVPARAKHGYGSGYGGGYGGVGGVSGGGVGGVSGGVSGGGTGSAAGGIGGETGGVARSAGSPAATVTDTRSVAARSSLAATGVPSVPLTGAGLLLLGGGATIVYLARPRPRPYPRRIR